MKAVCFLVVSIFLFVSCTQDSKDQAADHQNFDAFYEKFLSDSLFQLNHIQFPLTGQSSAYEQHSKDFKWSKQDWVIHRPIDPNSTGFESSFSKISEEFIVEKIMLKGGGYGMERRFSRFGQDGWYLIYYADLHAIATPG